MTLAQRVLVSLTPAILLQPGPTACRAFWSEHAWAFYPPGPLLNFQDRNSNSKLASYCAIELLMRCLLTYKLLQKETLNSCFSSFIINIQARRFKVTREVQKAKRLHKGKWALSQGLLVFGKTVKASVTLVLFVNPKRVGAPLHLVSKDLQPCQKSNSYP